VTWQSRHQKGGESAYAKASHQNSEYRGFPVMLVVIKTASPVNFEAVSLRHGREVVLSMSKVKGMQIDQTTPSLDLLKNVLDGTRVIRLICTPAVWKHV
jgi:hypothetical protein